MKKIGADGYWSAWVKISTGLKIVGLKGFGRKIASVTKVIGLEGSSRHISCGSASPISPIGIYLLSSIFKLINPFDLVYPE